VNILIVTNHFWPEEFRINDLALGLKERGHSISVLTGIPNYPAGRFFSGYGFFKKTSEVYNGINIYRAPLIPRGSASGIRLAINYVSYALSACLVAPFRCRDRYDLILVFESSPITVGLPAILLKWLKNIPIMFWVQDLWPDTLSATGVVRSERVLSWVTLLVRFIYKQCDSILIQSRAFAESVTNLAPSQTSVHYYPNSAEALYQPLLLDKNAPEFRLIPAGFRIMFAGNIGVAQDFETILAAAELLKDHHDIHWIIIGDGRKREWVEQEVIKRGLSEQFHLLGRYPVETMPRFFSHADAMLVTLKSEPIFALTIPSKIQSYLACARPIVAALDGEGALVIEEAGAGMVCSAEDSYALAESVLNMYRLPIHERKAIGECGREYFLKEFDREMLLDRMEELLLELVPRNI
jgi:glycosyltransferase involved in cell wall biosynthesis